MSNPENYKDVIIGEKENNPPEFEPMSDEKLLRLREIMEEGDLIALGEIHVKEFYRACIALDIPLPSTKQRATPMGRVEAIKRLRHLWAIHTRKKLYMREELREIRKRMEIIQKDIRWLAKVLVDAKK